MTIGGSSLVQAQTVDEGKAEPGPARQGTDEAFGFDEIVVTARRSNELLQDVPASVSVLTSRTIEEAGIRTGADAVQLTPGVTLIAGSDNFGDVQVNIRGLNGPRDAENNVALVVDGVLKSSKAALVQNQGVLQQVEVLKGPQGAIYGRNASAGVFVMTTKKPGDEVEAEVTFKAGNNNSYNAYGVLSAPINEELGVSISADWSSSDGFFRNSFLPSAENAAFYPNNSNEAASVDNNKQWNIYGRAVWTPSDVTEFDLKFRYGELDGAAINFNAVFQLPDFAEATDNPLFNEDVNDHEDVFASNIDNRNFQSNVEVSLRGSHDFDFATLSSYVSFNNFKNTLNADGTSGVFGFFAAEPTCVATLAALDGFPVQQPFGIGGGAFLPPYSPTTCDGTLNETHDQKDISAELRLASPDGSEIQWQAGVYYLHMIRRDCVGLQLDTGNGFDPKCFSANPLTRTEQLIDDQITTDVYAAFASVDYDFDDNWTAGIALRYDIEKRKTVSLVPTDARTLYVGNAISGFANGTPDTPANYFLNAGLDPFFNPSGRLDPRGETFKKLQPKVTISYRASPDLTIFANWGIGFRAGGFNGGGSKAIIEGFFNGIGANLTVDEAFRSETTSAFEVGFKGKAFDSRVSFEVAGYYTSITDMQYFELFVGPFGLLREVENIDSVKIYGFEANTTLRVTSGWNVFAGFNLTESEIKDFAVRPNTAGNTSPTTPDYTLNFGSNFFVPVSDDIDFTARADVRVTGPTYFSTVQDNTVPNIFTGLVGEGNFRNTQRDTFTMVNARAGFEFDVFSIHAYANNLFNVKNLREVIVAPEFGGAFNSPGSSRSYGVELKAKF
ncbi:MAG: TonB-dependent receptor [Deltaproteobacteria bacterium]|nr:TonB-dependent receptor [Deltaproteobacteria bacterium]